jgi:FkbM family methyltransferase
MPTNYSQYNEQAVIMAEFQNQTSGRFLDIGAYDGKTFSNTYALVEHGWSGVMVEPSPSVFPALIRNMKPHPSVQLVNTAVVPGTGGIIQMYDSGGDFLTSSDHAHMAKWSKVEFNPYWMHSIGVKQLFDQFGYDWDFISIDTEGTNLEILMDVAANITDKCRMVCVEYDNHMTRITELMNAAGFTSVHHNGTNIIFVRK